MDWLYSVEIMCLLLIVNAKYVNLNMTLKSEEQSKKENATLK